MKTKKKKLIYEFWSNNKITCLYELNYNGDILPREGEIVSYNDNVGTVKHIINNISDNYICIQILEEINDFSIIKHIVKHKYNISIDRHSGFASPERLRLVANIYKLSETAAYTIHKLFKKYVGG